MKKIILTTLSVIAYGMICVILASYYTEAKMNQVQAITLANSSLYDLGHMVDVLNELTDSEPRQQAIKDKLEEILVTSLVALRTINPNIEDLEGTPTNTLCRIIKYNRDIGIATNGSGKNIDKELVKLATSYLKNIEQPLRKVVENSAIPFHECNSLFNINKKYKILR